MKENGIKRFNNAQDRMNSYATALQEIRNGRKRSHWIWYVFPQISGLGYSLMSRKYAIRSLNEAKAFLEDETLGKRLREITEALLSHSDKDIVEILGKIDAIKVRSCMTLFDIVSPHDIFNNVLERFYDGRRCEHTVEAINTSLSTNNEI